MRRLGFAAAVLSIASMLAAAPATQPDLSSLKANDAVMVREGDSWSRATFVAREGRKFQVRYDDGTDEWVTADRLKSGAGAAPAAPAAGAAATRPAAANPAAPAAGAAATRPAAANPAAPAKAPGQTFVVGQKVELKYHARWEPVKVLNKRGDWYLVEYEKWNSWREWAEPWRLRKLGSTYDLEGMVAGNPKVRNNEGPPRPEPGSSPDEAKAMANAGRPGVGGGDGDAEVDRDDPFAPPKHAYPITPVKAQPQPVAANAPAGAWNVPAAALPATARLPATVKAGMLPPLEFGIDWGEPSIAGTRALIPVARSTGFTKVSGLARVNLMTGGVEKFELDPASAALALSPSGDLIACRSNGFHSGTKSRLDVYRLGPKIEHVISFFPLGEKEDIDNLFWVDEQNVVVVTGKSFSSWNVQTATGNWMLPSTFRKSDVSPDGKQLAAATDDGISIISLTNGTILGKLNGKLTFADLAYSGDGLRLFTYEGRTLRTWDLQTGLEDESVTLSGAPMAGKLIAPSKDFLLIGNALFAVQKKAFVWHYKPAGKMTLASGRVWTFGSEGNKKYLTSAVIPHPRALAAAQQAARPAALLKPGMSLSLDIQVEVDDAKRQEIIAALTKQLTQAGFKVADGQPLRLTARTADGESVTRNYELRQFGRPPGSGGKESVTFTPKITKLTLERDGKSIWETARSSGAIRALLFTSRKGRASSTRSTTRRCRSTGSPPSACRR